MITVNRAAAFRRSRVLLLGGVACFCIADAQAAGPKLHLDGNGQGGVHAFSVIDEPLADFAREYARVSGIPLTMAGDWDEFLKGSVTLYIRRDLNKEALAEVFYRVLAENGFAPIDAPAGNGLIIQAQRDARDGYLPIQDAKAITDSARLVTASYTLAHADAGIVARMMRSFMPAFSRIIPISKSLLITDIASNIRKLSFLIDRMDTPEGARKARELRDTRAESAENASCPEARIEKLVVENLEIANGATAPGPFSPSKVKK